MDFTNSRRKTENGMLNSNHRSSAPPLIAIRIILMLCLCLPVCALADDQISHEKEQSKSALTPIRLFQKFISPADGDRCPMHPSCSRYASEAVNREGIIKGWVLACDRLLRCGRNETRLSAPISVNGVRLTYDPLSANTFWWDNR